MIDSVLKGTGNSRFLKSAVPAGTSWADALAMLQAGTFPIDFNGINAEGFQQVGTPLNKANLLKDATAAQIGLPPSTTPDGMFQALGNTGELHVWRKTTVTPAGTTTTYPVSTNPNAYQEGEYGKAGYTLGDARRKIFYSGTDRLGFKYGDAITVSDDGKTIDIKNPSYQEWYGSNINNVTVMSGKFIRFTFYLNADHETSNPVYFMPSTSKMEYDSDANVSAIVQPVTGYAAIPANTTIEYLGKLGDKARVQMVSYIGTGTYGKANPCSLTFDFPPKILVRITVGGPGYSYPNAMQYRYLGAISLDGMTAEYKNYAGLSDQDDDPYSWGKLTDLGKKISWYNTHDAYKQMNSYGMAYTILALV